jgi:hypothetical protein
MGEDYEQEQGTGRPRQDCGAGGMEFGLWFSIQSVYLVV